MRLPCLIVTGEHDNEQRKRDAVSFLVSNYGARWRTQALKHFAPESNKKEKSYLVLENYMHFLIIIDREEKANEDICWRGEGDGAR